MAGRICKHLTVQQGQVGLWHETEGFDPQSLTVGSQRGTAVPARLEHHAQMAGEPAVSGRHAAIDGLEGARVHEGAFIEQMNCHSAMFEEREQAHAFLYARPRQPVVELPPRACIQFVARCGEIAPDQTGLCRMAIVYERCEAVCHRVSVGHVESSHDSQRVLVRQRNIGRPSILRIDPADSLGRSGCAYNARIPVTPCAARHPRAARAPRQRIMAGVE